MGSQINFNNIGEAAYREGSGLRHSGSYNSLARQSSVYSLTFDELQNTLGGVGKDLGSMNMDELLKSVWTAEETQSTTAVPAGRAGGSGAGGGDLQRQGSLTLPRTLSQKTVDEVWRDLSGDGGGGTGGSTVPQRQQTLGEMTLEEFLAKAGVVKEDLPRAGMTNDNSFFVQVSNAGLSLGFQDINNGNLMTTNNPVINHRACLATNAPGVKSSVPQLSQQHPIFPKQATVSFAPQMNLVNSSQIPNPGAKGSKVCTEKPTVNNNMTQSGGVHGGAIGTAGLRSPASQVPLDMVTKNNVEDSSLFPVPYVFSRGRKSGTAFEKVVERRQRRMIKNRESAARSRARKQAYTLELEAEIAKLKEINQELERKQAQIMEMQKTEVLEKLNRTGGGKRLCLRRTLTGPW